MNWKKFIIAVIVGFVALLVMDLIIHGVILCDTYESLSGTVFRAETDMKTWAMYIGTFIFALLFVWLYTFGVKGKGVMEGFRYGVYIGLFYSVTSSLYMWASMPIPASMAWLWAIIGLIEMIILGLIVGAIYKTPRA